MAYSLTNYRFLKTIKFALILLGATLLTGYRSDAVLANSTPSAPLADGLYLYGQQSTAAQPGSTYMVFEVADRHAVGAFYMPNSSFDCFYGDISERRLDLTIVDSYEQTRYPYSLVVQSEPVLAAGQAGVEFNIVGFTPIDTLSELDEHILETCQEDYALLGD